MDRTRACALSATLIASALVSATPALAQDKGIALEKVESKYDINGKKQGWDGTLAVGATLNFVDNRAVVGQAEGSTWNLGGTVNGTVEYVRLKHEVRGNLTIAEIFSRTPVIRQFINTSDMLAIDLTYYYSFQPWVGLFARAEARSSLFVGEDVRPEDVTYQITREDGAVDNLTQSRLRLRDPLRPFNFKESAGAFVRPISSTAFDLELRLGAGARQVIADGTLNINDDANTPQIEVVELANNAQIGAESAIAIKGELQGGRITYKSSLDALLPFYNSRNPDDQSTLELTNIEFATQVSVKLADWASLDYQFRVLRQPLLVEDVQIQNNLLLTIGYTLIQQRPVAEASE